LCKPPTSGEIEITDDGGFNYGKKKQQQTERANCRVRYQEYGAITSTSKIIFLGFMV